MLGKSELADFPAEILDYPERVLQIGEGNFLRAFFNWMLHEMNKKGIFKGRAAVIQPIPPGKVSDLNEQDDLYTLLLRGIQEGEEIDRREIITSISRGLESHQEWDEVLSLAENPDIDIVVSNTTEAGIAYNPEDDLNDNPPDSYPGKLTAYLKRRYDYFSGDRDKGMLIVPVELINRNGDELKRIIFKLANDWNLSADFKNWLEEANTFLNTLVDRIVPGYPEDEAKEIEQELGYRDRNMTAGEAFHLWIIEGDEKHKKKLPFHKAGLNVKWVDNMDPYRTRKVRILNGAHTSTVPVAYLSGIDLVREAVNDEVVAKFIEKSIFEEIIPTLDFDNEELESFANKILERFENPFIDHEWLDISLNSTSKFKTRVLPSLLKYQDKFNELPTNLVFSLSALIKFYKGKRIEKGKLIATRKGEEYAIKDENKSLEFFLSIWSRFKEGKISRYELVQETLSNKDFWEQDLTAIPGLVELTESYLNKIEENGMKTTLKSILQG